MFPKIECRFCIITWMFPFCGVFFATHLFPTAMNAFPWPILAPGALRWPFQRGGKIRNASRGWWRSRHQIVVCRFRKTDVLAVYDCVKCHSDLVQLCPDYTPKLILYKMHMLYVYKMLFRDSFYRGFAWPSIKCPPELPILSFYRELPSQHQKW